MTPYSDPFFCPTVRPHLIDAPADSTVLAGQSVDLACRVGGDPTPSVYWSRQNGRMPVGRIDLLPDKTLRIEQVQPQDEGRYVCEAENPVGNVTASATITVQCESGTGCEVTVVSGFR